MWIQFEVMLNALSQSTLQETRFLVYILCKRCLSTCLLMTVKVGVHVTLKPELSLFHFKRKNPAANVMLEKERALMEKEEEVSKKTQEHHLHNNYLNCIFVKNVLI